VSERGTAIPDAAYDHGLLDAVETEHGTVPRYVAERLGLVRTWIDDLPESQQVVARRTMRAKLLQLERDVLSGISAQAKNIL